jgi:hypothetical protein
MKLSRSLLLTIFSLCILRVTALAQNFDDIKKYKVNYALARISNKTSVKNISLDPNNIEGIEAFLAIRSFTYNDQKYILLVNPNSLETKTDLANQLRQRQLKICNFKMRGSTTPFRMKRALL